MKAKRVYSAIISLVVIGVILGGLFNNKRKLDEKAEQSLKGNTSVPVNVIKPQYIPDVNEVTIMGEVTSDNEVLIISKTDGFVIGKYKKLGDYVTKGTIIAKIEDEVINQKLHLAKQNLAKAQKDVERYHSLLESGAVTKMEVENVELCMRTAKGMVIELKEHLKNTIIVAPITGFLEKDFFEVGSLVSTGTIVAELVDAKKLKVNATISGKDLININKDASVDIFIDIYPNQIFEGKINSISSKGDESMTYTIELMFISDYSNLLKPGMYSQVKIRNSTSNIKKILTIERQCIVGSLKNPNVYVVENGKAYLKNITIGKIMNDRVEIISGINSNDIIVCNGQINLSNGNSVKVY